MRKHDACCGVLKDWLEDLGCHVESEVVLPGASANHPEARMDLIAHSPSITGPVHIDLTIVSSTAREALAKGSASKDGTAARGAEARKRAKYPLCPVLPFVIEDHGRLGEDALGFIRKVAPRGAVERSEAIRRLYQAIGATVQRSAANAIIAATCRSQAQE